MTRHRVIFLDKRGIAPPILRPASVSPFASDHINQWDAAPVPGMKNTRVKFKRDILEGGFSTARAARLTRLSPRQLDYWDRRGFLSPSLARAEGYGSARRYSFVDLVRLRVAARLRAAGLGLERIQQAVETLRRLDPARGQALSAHLLIAGSRVLWVRSEREIVDVLHEGQLMLVFSVGREVQAMATAVEQSSREQEEDAVVRPARAGHRR
jgi:DNA-binding transcriptional MerR regulator